MEHGFVGTQTLDGSAIRFGSVNDGGPETIIASRALSRESIPALAEEQAIGAYAQGLSVWPSPSRRKFENEYGRVHWNGTSSTRMSCVRRTSSRRNAARATVCGIA